MLAKKSTPVVAVVLHALIGVDDDLRGGATTPDGHQQCIHRQFARQAGFHRPANDRTLLEIYHHGQIQPNLAASKEFGERGVSVNAIGLGPMDTPFFYGQEKLDAVAYHKSAAALSKYSKTGLTDIEDISPLVKFLVTEGWWIIGRTIFANVATPPVEPA